MADSKYEIRSEEVQKMMNKPVNKRLLWGSTFILILLLTGVVFFNRVVITEYRKGTVYINAKPEIDLVIATVDNSDTANSLSKKIYLDVKSRLLEGTIENIIPLNSTNSNWLIRTDEPYDTLLNPPKLIAYKLVNRKKTLFTYIMRHFRLE